MQQPQFFALIIGTEILNRRRKDAHFDYVTQALLQKGYKLTGSLIIEDDPELIVQTIALIAKQPHAILFSFGGIGSTPDDHTRKCAAVALRDGILTTHEEAEQIIINTLQERAYPHSVKMAQLPKDADLIENPVNKMPAFSLDNRFFFMPGFPEMSHPMLDSILEKLIPEVKTHYRYTLTATTKESALIEIMEQMPQEVEFSSLPKLKEATTPPIWEVSISVASYDQVKAKEAFALFTTFLDHQNIAYRIAD